MKNLDPPDILLNIKAAKVKLVVVLVGLPATGKSFLSNKLHGYLEWIGFRTRTYNVGRYRRAKVGPQLSHFFDFNNPQGVMTRDQVEAEALSDMLTYFQNEGQIAILDGANATRRKRNFVRGYLARSGFKFQVIWVETIVNQAILQKNIAKFKVNSLDYFSVTKKDAEDDLKQRVKYFKKMYETLTETELELDNGIEEGFIQLCDNGKKVKGYCIRGYLPGRIMYYLINLRQNHNPIWFTRHGQSEFNVKKLLGGDSSLTPLGREYAKKLAKFMKEEKELKAQLNSLNIWCSTLKRTKETADVVSNVNQNTPSPIKWKSLDEINAGIFDAYTYAQIKEESPRDYKLRSVDKLRYRYPQGESYLDVVERLESVIFELEHARKPVLVVGHQAVLRCLYSYFLDLPMETTPYLEIPLHTLIKLTPSPYGCFEERFHLMDIPGEPETKPIKSEKKFNSYSRRTSSL